MSGIEPVLRSLRQLSVALFLSLNVVAFSVVFGFASDEPQKTKFDLSRKFSSGVKLAGFKAEKFAAATKISWKTSFEENVVGFRVWRETDGQNELVNHEMMPGSALKRRDAVLDSGDEYSVFDFDAQANSVYRLEAVYLDGRALWFGHFNAVEGFETDEIRSEIENNKRSAPSLDQTEAVELIAAKSAVSRKSPVPIAAFDDYANSSSAAKFQIKKSGWHRISATTLAAAGFSGNSQNWKLYADNVEHAFVVNADNSIEFYGRGLETVYADGRVYWLVNSNSAGKRIARSEQSFNKKARYGISRAIVEKKERTLRVGAIVNGARENWFGALVTSSGVNQTLNLTEVAFESGQTATLSVDLQGVTSMPHQVAVVLNGAEVGRIDYSYLDRREWSGTVAASRLVEGVNVVSLRSVGASPDLSVIESVRINYPRRMKAVNNSAAFQVNARESVLIKGFSAWDVRLFDVTDPANVTETVSGVRLEGDGTYSISYTASGGARVMLAQARNAPVQTIDSLVRNAPSNLKSSTNAANFVVVSPRAYFDSLAALKSSRDAEGLATQIVDIGDVYDEFNGGNKSAEAIRSFLRNAKENWAIKPSYVMLVGDASFDPRNYSGTGGDGADIVPTMFVETWNMEAVSDELLVDFNGDSIGEMAIGRLPVKNQADLSAMLQKIALASPASLADANRRGVSFVSDAPQGYDFAGASRRIAQPISSAIVPRYIDRAVMDAATMRNALLNTVNSGAAVVNYFGHGNVNNWNGNVLNTADAPAMINLHSPSLMVMVACLNGAFAEISGESLSESMMRAASGGAFAAWSASAMNGAETQEFLAKEFYRKVFAGMRLGDAARDAKAMFNDTDIRRTYVYFGDPTQRLVAP